METQHLSALLELAGTDEDGLWKILRDERTMSLQIASNGVGFSVSKVRKVRVDAELVLTENVSGETSVLRLQDIFAGSVDPASKESRKAGFR